MSVVVSHPTGNPNVRAVLRALEDTGKLDSFHTSVAVRRWLARMPLMPLALQHELDRRVFDEVPETRTVVQPYREVIRVVANRLNLRQLTRHEIGFASVDRVYHDLDRAVARYLEKPGPDVRAVYAYDDGALCTFRAARERGIKTIYELPIAHWRTARQVLAEERDLRPDWSATIDGLKDSRAKCARKDEEIILADQIIVPSAFTKKSLTEHFGDRLAIDIVPYGAPPPYVSRPGVRLAEEPLRIFYAGHLRQRKGVAYLFESMQLADFPWQLTLAGPKPAKTCLALERALDDPRCQWIGSVPHAKLLEEMTRAHVFVLPSLIEGLALVIMEALAAGLPVITTPNSGGTECIDEGVNGFIVPIRDAKAITDRLASLFDDEDRRFTMASAALTKAGRLTWARYEQRIAALVQKAIA
jgi:alpha-maltose-1-phosphate synthase